METTKRAGETSGKQGKQVLDSVGQTLNYDFCPWANRYVYWLKKPIGWVTCAAAFSGLVGLVIGPQGFVIMAAMIALLIIGAVWPWLSMKGVQCALKFKYPRTHENEPARAILEVTNRWPIPIFGLMVQGEFLQDIESEDDRIAVGLQRIPGWSVSKFEWTFEPKRRGVLPRQEPKITNGFPFGIYSSEKEVDISGQTIVWPQRQNLDGQPSLGGEQFNIGGMMSDRSGNDGDIIGVRNYREGDSLRHVHWAKTAMSRQLIVKERQTCAQKPIQILMDLTPQSHVGKGSQSSFEWTIRIASNICRHLHQRQAHLEVVCVGLPEGGLLKQTNRRGINPIFDFLALLPQQDDLEVTVKETSSLANVRLDGVQKTYVVCTNKSDLISEGTKTTWVILDSETFEINLSQHGPYREQTEEAAKSQDYTRKNTILIAAPHTVASDLSAGWERGCGNVA